MKAIRDFLESCAQMQYMETYVAGQLLAEAADTHDELVAMLCDCAEWLATENVNDEAVDCDEMRERVEALLAKVGGWPQPE